MTQTRYVLIVCYDFPWISAAGVIRTYQFAKNLPDFGWQPVILTAQSAAEREDNIEASDGPLPCPKFTATPARFPLPFRSNHRPLHEPLNGTRSAKGRMTQSFFRSASQFAVPDGKINWLRPATKLGLQIASEYPIQACFSVSPRPTAHLVGYRLARRLNIPWVADFALPWSDAYWLADRPRFVQWMDEQLESWIRTAAQHSTVAYAGIKHDMIARYGRAFDDKITVVPTGFEEELFTEPSPSPSRKFTFVHPGNHFCENGRDGENFFRAIDEWLELNPALEDAVDFAFIGKRDENLLRARAAMAHPKVIRIETLVSHRACIGAIRSSHACVVNTVGNRIPAKVYECMRAGKWIVALTDSGSDLEKLIGTYPKGVSVSAKDMSAIRSTLQSIFSRSQSLNPEANEDSKIFRLHSSKHSAEMVSQIFETILLNPQRNEAEAESGNGQPRTIRGHQSEVT